MSEQKENRPGQDRSGFQNTGSVLAANGTGTSDKGEAIGYDRFRSAPNYPQRLHGPENPAAVFIPDPNRWAVVTVSWSVFDVLGWRYDPVTDLSEPVVSCRGNRGAGTLRMTTDHILVPRWDGIVFGRSVWQQRHTAPASVLLSVERAEEKSRQESDRAMAAFDAEWAEVQR